MNENEISFSVIGIAIALHKTIGPGLLESAYASALAYDLIEHGFEIKTEVQMPFIYKDIKMDVGYKVDLIIENKVLIELKSVETLAPVFFSQTLTYLKLSGLKLGLLINFNTTLFKKGVKRVIIHRIVNKL